VQCSTQLQPAIPSSICKVEGIRIGKNTTRQEKKEKQKENERVDDDDGSWGVFEFHALDD